MRFWLRLTEGSDRQRRFRHRYGEVLARHIDQIIRLGTEGNVTLRHADQQVDVIFETGA